MKNDQIAERLNGCIAVEKISMEIYRTLERSFPEAGELWNLLANDEETHAAILTAIKDQTNTGNFPGEIAPASMPLIGKTLDMGRSILKQIVTDKQSLGEVLEMILLFEKSTIESYLREIMLKETDSAFLSKLQQLYSGEEAHEKVIMEYMKLGGLLDKSVNEIIGLCLSIDLIASEIYRELSESEKQAELKNFWEKMAEEEDEHIFFWKKTAHLTKERMIPQIFDDPLTIKRELQTIYSQVLELRAEPPMLRNSFLLAFRLEFYLLHPAFGTLFRFVKNFWGEKSPEDSYDRHIRSFIEALNTFGASTPEIELLGESLLRLWSENKDLVTERNTDHLTGIFNRHGFFRSIAPLMHMAQRNAFEIGIMMIDIDDFKKINDTLGHQTGDRVLKTVADLIKSQTRGSDVVARYGGEEFIVFLSKIDLKFLRDTAERIRKHIEKESANIVQVTVSIGIGYGVPDSVDRIDALIKSADECLYQAKKSGKNAVVLEGCRPMPGHF